jgi:hypothetical protein
MIILAAEIKSLPRGVPGLWIYGIGFEKSVERYFTFLLRSDELIIDFHYPKINILGTLHCHV